MIHMLTGGCVCQRVKYVVTLDSLDDARTTLCHCGSCRHAFGTNFGLTTKVPLKSFRYHSGKAKSYTQGNSVTREFCDTCGVFLCEYGRDAADKFRYVVWGTFDDAGLVPPKGEFFCQNRTPWMPQLPGLFQKQEIKE